MDLDKEELEATRNKIDQITTNLILENIDNYINPATPISKDIKKILKKNRKNLKLEELEKENNYKNTFIINKGLIGEYSKWRKDIKNGEGTITKPIKKLQNKHSKSRSNNAGN